ncbi:hypothetical protein Tco_1003026 [Tanacetum coccineum]|uniref:Uncharacterized protein n=1 Tax=Tanacetum coccineum TaxID=301880 RepID=A0ABQ5F9F8_9ASTR
MENLNLFYQDIGPSSSAGRHLTQEESAKEELAIRISQRYALLEEERHVIKTITYNDKYKKILDEIWKDKVELDGKNVKENEEEVKRIKGKALKEKDDPGAFIFPIRLEDMKKIDRGITMINHTQAEAMEKLSNVLFQVGVTTIIAKFLILNIPIDRDAPIVVGRGFLHTMAKSDSDDEEEYVIKRNKLCEQTMMRPDHHDPNDQDMKPWKRYCFHKFTTSFCYGKDVTEMQSLEIDDMLRIRVREAESEEVIFTSVAWMRDFNINEPIYAELCHEFFSTYEFDEVCADDELQTKKIIKFRLGGRAHRGLRNDENFNAQDYWLSISREDNLSFSRNHTSYKNPSLEAPKWICECSLGDCKMDEEERSWDSKRESNFPWQSYHWDKYHGVFEHMAGVYSVPLQGAYNPPGYAQPQYDQYYQPYPPLPPQQQQDDDE